MIALSVQPDNTAVVPSESNRATEADSSSLPARKIHRLLTYVENLGLDPVDIANSIGLDLADVFDATPDESIPSIYYALLYKESVVRLQHENRLIPWAAGIGSNAFRMMCYCIISCTTLRDALQRAQEFDALLYPITGHRMEFEITKPGSVRLSYVVDDSKNQDAFSPGKWTLDECVSVAKSSGIETWFGLCGWLIGRDIEATKVMVDSDAISPAYAERMEELYQCPVEFGARNTCIEFSEEQLDYRIVHDSRSLEDFLDTGPYQLWSSDNKVVSTSAAIRSLLGTDFRSGVPSFEEMASNMHMSPSTLRRHLLSEGTSYQKIKDESRREIAIEMLCFSDLKISDISEHVGFADTSSFVRSFRSWTGLTPKAYRESAKPLFRTERD
jgi:AraC-like DNA-binding protein